MIMIDCEQSLYFFALKSSRHHVWSWSRHLGFVQASEIWGEFKTTLGKGAGRSQSMIMMIIQITNTHFIDTDFHAEQVFGDDS